MCISYACVKYVFTAACNAVIWLPAAHSMVEQSQSLCSILRVDGRSLLIANEHCACSSNFHAQLAVQYNHYGRSSHTVCMAGACRSLKFGSLIAKVCIQHPMTRLQTWHNAHILITAKSTAKAARYNTASSADLLQETTITNLLQTLQKPTS